MNKKQKMLNKNRDTVRSLMFLTRVKTEPDGVRSFARSKRVNDTVIISRQLPRAVRVSLSFPQHKIVLCIFWEVCRWDKKAHLQNAIDTPV